MNIEEKTNFIISVHSKRRSYLEHNSVAKQSPSPGLLIPLEYCHNDSTHVVCDLEVPERGDNARKGLQDS